jgi:hypothetical protein
VSQYLDELPEERRAALATLRTPVRKIAPDAVEGMQHGMPSYAMGDMRAKGMASSAARRDGACVWRYRQTTEARAPAGVSRCHICSSFSITTPRSRGRPSLSGASSLPAAFQLRT